MSPMVDTQQVYGMVHRGERGPDTVTIFIVSSHAT